ncbi:MAG: dodecin domain-containing protein [Chloroflexi bacterium]|mgnify:CR=1 FL=1|nr:dodecin domain-containing protein [Chloroflexota bacterium]
MAQVAKVIELVGTSPTSWQDAVEAAVREASKTIRHITGVDILHTTADVEGDRITTWRVTVKIAFGIESERPPA